MKLLSVNLVDNTKLEVLVDDSVTSNDIFNVINSGSFFKAQTLSGEEAEVFVHGAQFSAFILSTYIPPVSQDIIIEAMSEFEKTQEVDLPIFFEGDNAKIYGNDGSLYDANQNVFNETDYITIV